jgi:hypothetical protein
MKSYLRLGYLLLKRSFWGKLYRYSETRYMRSKEELIALSVKMEMAK